MTRIDNEGVLVCMDCSGKLRRQPRPPATDPSLCAACCRKRIKTTRATQALNKLIPSIDCKTKSLCNGSRLDPVEDERALRDACELDQSSATRAQRMKHRLDELQAVVMHIERLSKGKIPAPTAELKRRLAWMRSDYEGTKRLSASKEAQWGPETTKAVQMIVRRAEAAFKKRQEGPDSSHWNSEAIRQGGRHYAALLCMKFGLLLPRNLADADKSAELVRARLNRANKTPACISKQQH